MLGTGKTPAAPCGCCQPDGTYGVVFNQAGEPRQCPNCNGTGSTDPDFTPRFKCYNMIPVSGSNTFLSALAAFDGTITIDAQYDFCGIWLTSSSTSQLANTAVGGGFTIELWDPSKQRPWQDAPVYINNIAGTGQRPFPLGLCPQRIPANYNLPFRIVDTSNASNTIQVTYSGYEMVPIVQTAMPVAA